MAEIFRWLAACVVIGAAITSVQNCEIERTRIERYAFCLERNSVDVCAAILDVQ